MIRTALIALLLAVAIEAGEPRYVRIPAGEMAGRKFSEPFWMGRTEVTVAEFRAFAQATSYRTMAEKEGASRTWQVPGFRTSPRQPVVYVTFQDAAAYCEWAGGRLPTDAEWEYAARAGAQTVHYWGDNIDGNYLWYRANSNDQPQPVGRKRPNAWGLYDVEGNVWEWTVDETIKGEPSARRRGGSWVDCAFIDGGPGKPQSLLIGLERYYSIPVKLNHRYDDIGFRCASTRR